MTYKNDPSRETQIHPDLSSFYFVIRSIKVLNFFKNLKQKKIYWLKLGLLSKN